MREVTGIWLRWVLSSALLLVGGCCIPSSYICCSTAITPSFFLLGVFLFNFPQARLRRAPCCQLSCWTVKAAFIARVQYCWVSRWDVVSSLKLTSSKNRQLSETSSGLSSESLAISCSKSSDCLLLKYPWCLLCKEMFRYIHCEWVNWRIFAINCFVQLDPLRKLLDIDRWKH